MNLFLFARQIAEPVIRAPAAVDIKFERSIKTLSQRRQFYR
jgi:hypothetical protein